ncbi:MAG: hypothetical protein PVH28_13710, partial [Desulfobacterales bacterium]
NLQAISKIVDYAQEQGKSRRKSAAYVQYVSILRRLLTQLLSVRCIFEMACIEPADNIEWIFASSNKRLEISNVII